MKGYIYFLCCNGTLWTEPNSVDVGDREMRVYYDDDIGLHITAVESRPEDGHWEPDSLNMVQRAAALELIQQAIDDADMYGTDVHDEENGGMSNCLGYN